MHIDRTVFAELQESAGADFVAELCRHLPRRRAGADRRAAHASAADAERFRRAAHSLKSNGNTFWRPRPGGKARELEMRPGRRRRGRRGGDRRDRRRRAADAAAELKSLSHG